MNQILESTCPDGNSLVERFAALFQGLTRAFGQYIVPRGAKADDRGKIKGTASTWDKQPLQLADYQAHLDNERGLGICPLTDDDTCWFAAIDVDLYPIDHRNYRARRKAQSAIGSLFAFGIYLKRRHGPPVWRDEARRYNQTYFDPPLRPDEMRDTLNSVGRRDYQYPCDKEPIANYCNRAACVKRQFGVRGGNDERVFGDVKFGRLRPPVHTPRPWLEIRPARGCPRPQSARP
jgi:hypothetical protein